MGKVCLLHALMSRDECINNQLKYRGIYISLNGKINSGMISLCVYHCGDVNMVLKIIVHSNGVSGDYQSCQL
jgi:hypothetical protein